MSTAYTACWWVPAGQRPTTDEAEQRLCHLRIHGPTPHAFTLCNSLPPPEADKSGQPVRGSEDWLCPA